MEVSVFETDEDVSPELETDNMYDWLGPNEKCYTCHRKGTVYEFRVHDEATEKAAEILGRYKCRHCGYSWN
jgi:DNA-directed RNA polymerase subunit M/transcription elongation factor TFIIS